MSTTVLGTTNPNQVLDRSQTTPWTRVGREWRYTELFDAGQKLTATYTPWPIALSWLASGARPNRSKAGWRIQVFERSPIARSYMPIRWCQTIAPRVVLHHKASKAPLRRRSASAIGSIIIITHPRCRNGLTCALEDLNGTRRESSSSPSCIS